MLHSINNKEQILQLLNTDQDNFLFTANNIRKNHCGESFEPCAIFNGKCGKCSEDCAFCAQSIHNCAQIEEFPLVSPAKLLAGAKIAAEQGVLRYSIVTSGHGLSNREVEQLCLVYRAIKEQTNLKLCASHGLLELKQLIMLKEAGVSRYHCNLETSRSFFPQICTTHNYNEKISTIKIAQKAGLEVCSGGIFGLGESIEDRIDMAFELRGLNIKSVPINILVPIKGTKSAANPPLDYEEIMLSVAATRLVLPNAVIRLAGGRNNLPDKGAKLFLCGANAAICGDMLTTKGVNIQEDFKMIAELGWDVKLL
ncbi:MAG: biotin synthase BioB [Clostridia bacterium]|nr:biotin synthase BioB [Clostridia bacterium]